MEVIQYLVPRLGIVLIYLVLLVGWVWALIDVLRREESYVWLFALMLAAPLAIPIYWGNRFTADPIGRALARQAQTRRLAELEREATKGGTTIRRDTERAELLLERGRHEEALRVLAGVLDLDDTNLDAMFLAAKALERTTRMAPALEYYLTIVDNSLLYRDGEALGAAADLLLHMNRAAEVPPLVQRFQAKRRSLPLGVREAKAHLALGNREKAAALLDDLLDSQNDWAQKRDAAWLAEARRLMKVARS